MYLRLEVYDELRREESFQTIKLNRAEKLFYTVEKAKRESLNGEVAIFSANGLFLQAVAKIISNSNCEQENISFHNVDEELQNKIHCVIVDRESYKEERIISCYMPNIAILINERDQQ